MNLATTVALSLLAPQGVESAGPMVGVPHAVSVAAGTTDGTVALDDSRVYYKEGGLYAGPVTPWTPTSGVPDFDRKKLFAGLSKFPDIASMSLGLDWILADATGKLTVPPLGWGMLTMSFTRASVGASGVLKAEAGSSEGAAADLFSDIVPGSTSAPAGWIGVLQRGQNSTELAVGGAARDVDAHDIFIAGYLMAPPIVAMLPARPSFFFTVSKATLGDTPSGWWGTSTKSGATILITTWTPSTGGGGSWSTPRVFLEYGALGLTAAEEIDALAIDSVRYPPRMLFSTRTKTRDPLLIAMPGSGGITVSTYTLGSGTPVSKALGMKLLTDDVDAICSTDPGAAPHAQYLQHVLGRPVRNPLIRQMPHHGSVSVFRRRPPRQNDDIIQCWMVGWPRQGNPQQSIAILGLTFPTVPGVGLIPVGSVSKNPLPNLPAGAPAGIQFGFPARFSRQGLPIQFNWICGELNSSAVTLPFPAVLRL